MSLLRLSINGRLGLSMATLGLLSVGIGIFGLVGMQSSNQATREIYTVEIPKTQAVSEMTIMVGRQRTSLDRAGINPGSDDAAKMYVKEREVAASADQAWNRYVASPHDAQEGRLAQTVTADYQETQSALAKFKEATRQENRDDILKYMVVVGAAYTKMQTSADALKSYQLEEADQKYRHSQHLYEAFKLGSLGVILLGLMTATWSWFRLRRAIIGPIEEAMRHFGAIANGDLSQRIRIHAQDEMGRLLSGLGAMQDSLRRIVVSIRGGSAAIAGAAQQIAVGNSDLSARTEAQAASVEETAASAEELTGTVQQNAENAEHARELVGNASDIARKGRQVISSVVTTMGEIKTDASAISEITAMIEGIAFQTNILALNAAVEAARAGDQGRGFAVVAGEVRTLAKRSSTAAKEIKDLIDTSNGRVEKGSEQVALAGATMSEIIDAVQRVHAIMDDISAASREQSHGIGQVSTAVSHLDQGVQQNAALVEQSTAAVTALQEQADSLAKAAAMFRVLIEDEALHSHAVPTDIR